MSKVITFSKVFPSYHPRKGMPTYFVEKLYASLGYDVSDEERNFNPRLSLDKFSPKHHTIRAGRRWKVGDKFSPRIWSGKPYQSKQQIIAPDITIKRIWDFEIKKFSFYISGESFYVQHQSEFHSHLEFLAKNDGLSVQDLFAWFKIPCEFEGQIICWNENINY